MMPGRDGCGLRLNRYPRDDSEHDRSSDVCSLYRVTQFKERL